MAAETSSTRPYMIRAWHEWCTDNNLTPYLLVKVDHTVAVPREFVQNGEIVLNIGLDATGAMHLGNDVIRFKARFSGRVRDITVPVDRVQAIYARETGQGMGFEVLEDEAPSEAAEAGFDDASTAETTQAAVPVRPAGLSVVSRTAEDGGDKPEGGATQGGSGKSGGLRIVK